MARARKSKTELLPQADPAAQLDVAAFLAAAQPVLAELTADLLERADSDAGIRAGLKKRHAFEVASKWTGESLDVWRRPVVLQIATAWLLSCVFVRTLEDRGLLARSRIAGPGSVDSQEMFQRMAPHLGEREYLLMVFRELEHFPATRALFDAEHSLVWQLGPSSTAAKSLLSLFRGVDPEQPGFRFGQASTRFLGDLYQHISAEIRARYALLQTPDFIESFILDQTIDPAIEEFGLEETTIIDPTCGSGHFLLGAFARLYDGWCARAPNESAEQTVERALGSVFGVDINPYAVAIARFRLTLAALEKIGVSRIADAPALPLHVTVGDALWESLEGVSLQLQVATSPDEGPNRFRMLNQAETRDFLYRPHTAVVGNPPYITEKNPMLREAYRKLYESAAGKYALSAPFMERFFQIGRPGAFVGQITSNSFMKREFGKALIQKVLPLVDLQIIINTSGAYIPGHGTPTVLVFGRRRKPASTHVRAVLARRGEPSAPEDAAQGLVWRSITNHWTDQGFENEYITVQPVERASLDLHPWSLEGGGAGDVKALVEEQAEKRLGDVCDSIGIASFTLEDDVYLRGPGAWERLKVRGAVQRPMVTGEAIRDWTIAPDLVAFFPYDENFEPVLPTDEDLTCLWPYRTTIANNILFGGMTKVQGGLRWYEFGRLSASKLKTPLTITFAEVATHNHFVLDRGGKIFKQTAPIIKLPATATEEDHLALLAYLNSSTACFWLKQVCQPKGSATRDAMAPENNRYAFNATGLSHFPLPANWKTAHLIELSRTADNVARDRARLTPESLMADGSIWSEVSSLTEALGRAAIEDAGLFRRLVYLQEEMDWLTYGLYGITELSSPPRDLSKGAIEPDERPFAWDDSSAPATLSPSLRKAYESRRKLLEQDPNVALIECATMKRLWRGSAGESGRYGVTWEDRVRGAAAEWLANRLEAETAQRDGTMSAGALVAAVKKDERLLAVASIYQGRPDVDLKGLVLTIFDSDAVPYNVLYTYSPSGLVKREVWEEVWDLQRREDAGEKLDIPVPPSYSQGSRGKSSDFLKDEFWKVRGKLDVPKERFISYPGCESDKDHEPVYGWAGWDHLQRAQALATLYRDRKTNEAWPTSRLIPMLAGILELIPWLLQWHNEPHPEFGPQGDFFVDWLDGELREHKLTRADLEAWRPESRSGRKKTTTKTESLDLFADDTNVPAAAPKKRGRKKKS